MKRSLDVGCFMSWFRKNGCMALPHALLPNLRMQPSPHQRVHAFAEACSTLHEAMAVARSQGATTFALRAALDLAEHDAQEGRRALRSLLATFPEPVPWSEIESAHRILAGGNESRAARTQAARTGL